MTEQQKSRRKPNPEKVAILRNLPLEIKQQITGEEADAFIHDEAVPDSLLAKLKDFLVDDES